MTFIAHPALNSDHSVELPYGIYKMHIATPKTATDKFNDTREDLVGTLTGRLACMDTKKIAENIAEILNGAKPPHAADSDKIIQYYNVAERDNNTSFIIVERDASVGGTPTAKENSVLFKPDSAYKGSKLFTAEFFEKLCGATPYNANESTQKPKQHAPRPHA